MHLLCAGLLCLCGRALGYTGWVGGVQLCNSLCNIWLARGLAFCLFCVQVSFVCVTEPLVTPVGWVGCSSAIPSVLLGWPGGLPYACFVAGLLCLDVRVFLTSGLATLLRHPEGLGFSVVALACCLSRPRFLRFTFLLRWRAFWAGRVATWAFLPPVGMTGGPPHHPLLSTPSSPPLAKQAQELLCR